MGDHYTVGMQHLEWCDSWRAIVKQRGDVPADFFRAEARGLWALREVQVSQMRRARDGELINARDVSAMESVCADLRECVPDMPAVLLHGDLWSGNLHVCGDGGPALIDAGAVHYGWAEAELAMLTLFDSPPSAFFDIYAEHAPLHRGWRERAPLYNLYHLLNHVNLFGAGYLPGLRAALARCG